MRRVIKNNTSEIIIHNLKYKKGDSNNNKKIAEILYKEQHGFCVYTEEYIGRTDAKDIEHFNPNFKYTEEDNYNNWFLVKHQWNKEKSNNWLEPILHPTAENFENRIVYNNGDYIASNLDDIEANNLIELINLSDQILASDRKKYIRRKKNEIEVFGSSPKDFFILLLNEDISQINYIRAIKEEFDIDIIELIEKY
jgi:hypothetical protein